MEYKEYTGKSVNDLITDACQDLGVTSDRLDYVVVEEGSAGFLGIGAKNAVIKARIKSEEDEAVNEVAAEEPAASAYAEEAAPAAEAVAEEKKETSKGSNIVPVSDPSKYEAAAVKFLDDVFKAMNLEASVKTSFDLSENALDIELEGEEMGTIIGQRGATLDSLQYLVSLVVNKGSATYVRVKLDTENYRERRKATLENLAKNISIKVRKTRQNVYLEPMNPYERRIIHSALQDDPFVTTHSEGEEPDRKVVVTLRADADLEALDRKYGEKRYRGGYRRSGRGNRRGYSRRRGDDNYSGNSDMDPVQIPDTGSADSTGE